MKLSKRDKGLLLVIAGVLVVAAVYSLIYTPGLEEIATMQAQITTLETEVEEYREYEMYREQYLSDIVIMDEKIDAIVKEFPAGIQPETEIMYVVEMEENIGVEIPTINY